MDEKMSAEGGSATGGKKKIMFTLAILVLVFGVAAYLKTQAGTGENGSGWPGGWSDDGAGNSTGLGWISMNSTNCDKDNNGFIDVRYCDLDNNTFLDVACGGNNTSTLASSCGGNNTTTPVVNYGVNIPSSGSVTGPGGGQPYIWSENVGWIDFNPAGPPTTGCNPSPCPTTGVTRSGNSLNGWARISGIATESAAGNSGGWQGWVKMSGTTEAGGSYGVTIDPATGNLSGCGTGGTGCAWSDELGWIDFSKASIIQTPAFIVCPSSATLTLGSSSQLTAYYIPGGTISCSDTTGATNVTSDPGTIWTSNNDAIVLVDNGAQKGKITGSSLGGPINVNAAYSGLTASSAVTVIPLPAFCGDGNIDSGEECDDGASNGPCPANCSDSCAVNSCSNANWKEVAP